MNDFDAATQPQRKEVNHMDNNKKPHTPEEEECGAQEIRLEQLDERFHCEIDGTPIQNIKSYSCVQCSNGNLLLNLTLELNAAVVSTTIKAAKKSSL